MNVFDRWKKLIAETGLVEREDDKGMKCKVKQGFYKGIRLASMNGYIHLHFDVYSLEEKSPSSKRTYVCFCKTRKFRSKDTVEVAIELVKKSMKQIDELLAQGYKQACWYSLDVPENCHYDPETYESTLR